MSDDTNFTSGTVIGGSKMKPKNGYGQNGFQGASSDLPGEHTTSGFLPAASVPGEDWQTRKVSAEQGVPTHPGMKSRSEPTKVLGHNTRRANAPRTGTHFQR